MCRIAVASLAALTIVAAPADAAPVQRLARGPAVAGPVVAGGTVLWSDHTGSGAHERYVVRDASAIRYSTGAASSFDGENSESWDFAFDASATSIGVLARFEEQTGVSDSGDISLGFGAFGAPKLATVWSCQSPDGAPPDADADLMAVSGDTVVYQQPCGSAPLRVRSGTTDTDVPVPAGETATGADIAGDYLATLSASEAGARLRVLRRSTGEVVVDAPGLPAGGAHVAIQDDGTAAFARSLEDFAGCSGSELRLFSPAEPKGHVVPDVRPCGAVAIASGRVVYRDGDGAVHATDAAGHDTLLVAGARARSVATDGTTVAFSAGDCDGTAIYSAPAAAASDPLSIPQACPVTVLSRTLKVRRRSVTVRLRCPQGCHLDASIVSRRTTTTHHLLSDIVEIQKGPGAVAVRLAVGTVRRGRRIRGLLRLQLYPTSGAGRLAPRYSRVTIAG